MQLPERELLKFSEVGTGNPMRCHRCESVRFMKNFTDSTNIFGGGGVSAVEKL